MGQPAPSAVLDFSDARKHNQAVRLTSKGRYGLKALFFLAFHRPGRPAQMREVAAQAHIPARFLEQILHELKRAGILLAKRGPKGGYQLARPAARVSLGDVVRALEGSTLALTRSDQRDAWRDPVASVLIDVSHQVERCFDQVTLADLCVRAERLGVRRKDAAPSASEEGPEYAI